MKVAVVILNYNGLSHLQKYLPTLIKNTDRYVDIIIGDNCSTDGSVEYLERNFPELPIIKNDENYGFAGGYNEVLRKIEAEYYVLLNSDVEVTSNWVNPIIELMKADKSIAACSPKILSYTNKKYFEHAGAAGGYIDKYGFPFCKGRVFDYVEEDNAQYDGDFEVFWCSGAAMFVRSDLFWKGGGFDADFFAHMEEIDWCWRMKNMGYKIMSSSRSSVYHLGGGTLSYVSPFKTYLNFRNNLSMIYKNSEKPNILILKRKLIDGIAALKFLLSGDLKNFKAVYKGHRDFNKQKKALLLKRESLKSQLKKFSNNGVLNSSLVVEFYLKKKKTFSSLEGNLK